MIRKQFVACAVVAAFNLLGLQWAGADEGIAVAADTPLMLQTDERSPRQLIKDRADAAEKMRQPGAVPLQRRGGRAPDVSPPGFPGLMEQAAERCDAGRAAEALPLLHAMRNEYAGDVGFRFVQASAHLQLHDTAARIDFDNLLIQRPDLVIAYLGRGLAAGRTGSIPRMQADLAIARALDPAQAAAFEAEHRKELDEIIASAPRESAKDLSDQLITAAQTGADAPALLPIAMKLRHAVNLSRRVPHELYQDGLRLCCAAVQAQPADAQSWANLATYLYQHASTKYGRETDSFNAIEWQNDMVLAMRFSSQALTIDPRNLTALATKAWLLEQDNQGRDATDLANIGLQIAPGFPRLAKLQSILLNVSAIQAQNEAARQRAPKTFTTYSPDWIITWRRGPNDAELARAREFDAMSAANISQANATQFQAWQRFGNSIAEMNVAAGFYDYIGNTDQALALWNQVLKLDPNNEQALEDLLSYYQDTQQDDLAFQTRFRLENLCANSVTALLQKMDKELGDNDIARAKQDAALAMTTDPAKSTVYLYLARIAMSEHGEEAWWQYARCGEALEEASAALFGVNVDPGATDPVDADRVRSVIGYWNTELQHAGNSSHPDLADHYRQLIRAMRARIKAEEPTVAEAAAAAVARHRTLQDAANKMWPPSAESARAENAASVAWREAQQASAKANVEGEREFLEHINVLIADGEMAAAARRVLAPGRVGGTGHPESNGLELDAEYPIYQYLVARLYHYQLWHYFGPNTLETYEAYSRWHQGLDPNSPPSRGYAPQSVR